MDSTPKRGRGRPKKDPADIRSERIEAKLTPAERALIDSVTDTPSEWAREVLLRAAKRRSG